MSSDVPEDFVQPFDSDADPLFDRLGSAVGNSLRLLESEPDCIDLLHDAIVEIARGTLSAFNDVPQLCLAVTQCALRFDACRDVGGDPAKAVDLAGAVAEGKLAHDAGVQTVGVTR